MSDRLNIEHLEQAAAAVGDLSRYAIAKRIGVSQSTISRLANGECLPSARTQRLIMKTYKIAHDDLITDGDHEPVAA